MHSLKATHIPLSELRQNGAIWVDAWVITLWHGEHLNPTHVSRCVKQSGRSPGNSTWCVRD
ncbi:hypothetical protein FRX31_008828 [Thalictrum thalictroides]|uniref:Uncharacterized protein n=1 Tax=Thalictrum thalictroides TaxID=46969 RepID=A0A7J6WXF7_THATH|nr:hypothetical protein FRX31_008828 [Thalictrum thalictroides]